MEGSLQGKVSSLGWPEGGSIDEESQEGHLKGRSTPDPSAGMPSCRGGVSSHMTLES